MDRVFNCLASGAGCLGAENEACRRTPRLLEKHERPARKTSSNDLRAQFVSPWRRSGWETAWSASGRGGILAGAAAVGGGGNGVAGGGEMAPWPPEAAREVVLLALSFGRQRRHARLPLSLDP